LTAQMEQADVKVKIFGLNTEAPEIKDVTLWELDDIENGERVCVCVCVCVFDFFFLWKSSCKITLS
jgi:hypothetical protein